jgi:carboxyl-terminal processing protease
VEEAAPDTFSESDLRGSLSNDTLTDEEASQLEEDRARAQAAADLREEDYQLAYAIDILKGLSALGPDPAPRPRQAAEAQTGTADDTAEP